MVNENKIVCGPISSPGTPVRKHPGYIPFREACHNIFLNFFAPARKKMAVKTIPYDFSEKLDALEAIEKTHPFNLRMLADTFMPKPSSWQYAKNTIIVFGSARSGPGARRGKPVNIIALENSLLENLIQKHGAEFLVYVPPVFLGEEDTIGGSFPDIKTVKSWDEVFHYTSGSCAAYTYDAEKAICALAYDVPLTVLGNPDYAGRGFTIDSAETGQREKISFWNWFGRQTLLHHYSLTVLGGAHTLTLWQAAALFCAIMDPVLASMLDIGDFRHFPTIGPTSKLDFEKHMEKPELAEMGKHLPIALNTFAIGRYLLAIMENADPLPAFKELGNVQGCLPGVLPIITLANFLQLRLTNKYVPGIFEVYVNAIQNRPGGATTDDFYNIFMLWRTCVSSFWHYSPMNLCELINFDNIVSHDVKSSLLKLLIRTLLKTNNTYNQIENLLWCHSESDNYEFWRDISELFNMRKPDEDSGARRRALQERYARKFLKSANRNFSSDIDKIINRASFHLVLQNNDNFIVELHNIANTFGDMQKGERISSIINRLLDLFIVSLAFFEKTGFGEIYSYLFNELEPHFTWKHVIHTKYSKLRMENQKRLNIPLDKWSEYEESFSRQTDAFLKLCNQKKDFQFVKQLASKACAMAGDFDAAADYSTPLRNGATLHFWTDYFQRSWYEFMETGGKIAASVPQPQNPSAVVFVVTCPPNAVQFTAITPLFAAELKRRNVAVIHIMQGTIRDQKTGIPAIDRFSGLVPDNVTDGKIVKNWHIDLERAICSCDGTNMFAGLYDRLTILFRRSQFEYNAPVIKNYIDEYIQKMDYCYRVCERIYNDVTAKGMPTIFMTNAPHNASTSVFRDFAYFWNDKNPNLRLVDLSLVYENYGSGYKTTLATAFDILDLTRHRGAMWAGYPVKEDFEAWFEAHRHDALIQKTGQKYAANQLAHANTEAISPVCETIARASKTGRKIICLFGRLTCDLGLPRLDGPAHASMADWLNHTIKVLGGKDGVLLLIKPHPGEKLPEIATDFVQPLRDLLPAELPDNVLYLAPDELNNHELAPLLDLALTWFGTSTAEMLAFGVPVMTCSHFGRTVYHFTPLAPESREQYARFLRAGTFPKPDVETVQKATAFLHYIGSPQEHFPWPYSAYPLTNVALQSPQWHMDAVREFMAHGDKNIARAINKILDFLPEKNGNGQRVSA